MSKNQKQLDYTSLILDEEEIVNEPTRIVLNEKLIENKKLVNNLIPFVTKPKKVPLNSIITKKLMNDIREFRKKYKLSITDTLETLLRAGLKQYDC